MVFPNSNLPSTSQPWGREVQKRIEDTEKTVKANNLNNTARDVQLEANYKRLDKAINDLKVTQDTLDTTVTEVATVANTASTAATNANSALTGLGSLDEATSTYKINASNLTVGTLDASVVTVTNLSASSITTGTFSGDRITGGTITGTVIKSAASGQRVEVQGTQMVFYNSGGTSVIASATSSAFALSGFGGSLSLTSSGAHILGSGGSTGIWLGDYSNSSTINVTGGQLNVAGEIYSSVAVTVNGSLTRSDLGGGTLTGASITAGGSIVRTSSSERYKQDITDLELNYEDILALQPKKFRRKDEVEANPNARYYAGFIAEQIAGTALDIFAFYQSEADGGNPDGVHYAELTAALVSAIKHQDSLIKQLDARITSLENK